MITVDKLDTPEIRAFLTRLIIDIIKEALNDKPAENQLAMLLYAHIKDMESFRHDVLARLSALEVQMSEVNKRLDKIESTMATKDDLKQYATKEDLKAFATKEDLKAFATKEDLKAFATKEDLKAFATKEDLKAFATKEDLKAFATKEDLKAFGADIVTKIANYLKKHQFKK